MMGHLFLYIGITLAVFKGDGKYHLLSKDWKYGLMAWEESESFVLINM